MTPLTRFQSVPKNGQVQLRALARSLCLSNHRFHELSICNAVPYIDGACIGPSVIHDLDPWKQNVLEEGPADREDFAQLGLRRRGVAEYWGC
jgi:hypothetical protein